MNELIAELAERAAQESALLENDMNLQVEFDEKTFEIPATFIKQFAELIVNECIETLGTFEDYWPHEQQMNLLKKHFGVEE